MPNLGSTPLCLVSVYWCCYPMSVVTSISSSWLSVTESSLANRLVNLPIWGLLSTL